MPIETLKVGEQRVRQGRGFRKTEAHYRTIKLELDNLRAGSRTTLGMWEAGEEGWTDSLAVSQLTSQLPPSIVLKLSRSFAFTKLISPDLGKFSNLQRYPWHIISIRSPVPFTFSHTSRLHLFIFHTIFQTDICRDSQIAYS